MKRARPVLGVHAPPPRPTFAARAIVAAVLCLVWLAALGVAGAVF